jgi:MoaA/NifB/PqqE/SkfB family radical SAM enzyme
MNYGTYILDVFAFFKTLTLKKIINGILLRVSYFLSKKSGKYMHWGQPESLSIEPTNLCNLKCPECPSGNNSMTRPRLFLSLENFKKVINGSYITLAYLQLFFQGEPFLHPKLLEFIKYATSKKVYTATSTNGLFLNPENCTKIIESGLQRIIISVDGTTQETYEKYRVGGSLDSVLKGIKNLIDARKSRKSKTPFIIMQFVVFSTNEHQIAAIKQLAKLLKVDKLELKTAQIDDFKNGNPLIPKNTKYSRYLKQGNGSYKLKRNENFKCRRIWNGSVVSADNCLLPCCFDKNAKYTYNSLNNKPLETIWKGEIAQEFRKKVWQNYTGFDICRNCTEGLK